MPGGHRYFLDNIKIFLEYYLFYWIFAEWREYVKIPVKIHKHVFHKSSANFMKRKENDEIEYQVDITT